MAHILWVGRKCICGLDLSFTFYKITDEKLFVKKGMIGFDEEEVYLYKIKDKKFTQDAVQKMFGTGTIKITLTDGEASYITIKNVKTPFKVKKILDQAVQDSKTAYGLHGTEMFGASMQANGLK